MRMNQEGWVQRTHQDHPQVVWLSVFEQMARKLLVQVRRDIFVLLAILRVGRWRLRGGRGVFDGLGLMGW